MNFQLVIDVEYEPNGESEETIRRLLDRAAFDLAGHGALTGETAAVVASWKHRVLSRDVGEAAIPAECHSDDHNAKANFDALPWFEQASDEDITALADSGWASDYPADGVAEYMEDRNADVANVFAYIEGGEQGFECSVDKDKALAWLKENRPDLHGRMETMGLG